MKEVYITSAAVATGLGDLEQTWERLVAGESAIGPVSHFSTKGLASNLTSSIDALWECSIKNRLCTLTSYVLDSLPALPTDTFIIWAGIKPDTEYIESGQAPGIFYLPEQYRRWVATQLTLIDNIKDTEPRETNHGDRPRIIKEELWKTDNGLEINAACASSTVAIALGAHKIASEQRRCVLVVAADMVSHFTFTGFCALKALTPDCCRPFDAARNGLCIGDGAAAMVLCDRKTAEELNLLISAKLTGWGISNDANHITGPCRDGAGLTLAMEQALAMAGTSPAKVGAFCAHGTGTIFNDAMELAAIDKIFSCGRLPVFSVKGAIGHTLGPAGAIEAALCTKALQKGLIPPTVGMLKPEQAAPGGVATGPQCIDIPCILTTNSGFGGVNAALVLHGC